MPRKREDYTRLVVAALILSLGVLVAFQIYLLREPARIQSVLAADQAQRISRGQALFTTNCSPCHGDNGEGNIGPALNSKTFLKNTDDNTIASLIGSGVPGSRMPSWSQQFGGPFPDEQITDLVTFIRQWEPTATDVAAAATPQPPPDAAQGAVLFSTTCAACHGINGQGTNTAPPLNYKQLLTTFDDSWFRQTIAQGRPSRGMPTWGKVLSPAQIDSVVAYIRTWQAVAPASIGVLPGADPIQGAALFNATCIVCHGANGAGSAQGPRLNSPDLRNANTPAEIAQIVSDGRLDKGMPAWGRVLSATEIGNLVAYIEWMGSSAPLPTAVPQAATAVPTATGPRVATAADVQAGQALFQQVGCVKCHGAQGQGGLGAKLVGANLTHDKIVQQVRTPPPGLMPPFSTSQVSDNQLEQIIAFVLSLK